MSTQPPPQLNTSASSETTRLIISSVTTLSAALLGALLGSHLTYNFTRSGDLEKRQYELNRQTLSNILEKTIDYSTYNTVDWDRLKKRVRPYTCQFTQEVEGLLKQYSDNKKDILGVYCVHSHLLNNARDDFRRLTMGTRITGSKEVVEAVKKVESGFDEVMLEIAKKGHYSRVLIDKYNEVMPEKFANLERVFKEEVSRDLESAKAK